MTMSEVSQEAREFAPCPTCRQYSHSIAEDQLAAAYNHFQSMYAHPVRGHPMGHNFDEKTRDAAQVLMSAARALSPSEVVIHEGVIERLRGLLARFDLPLRVESSIYDSMAASIVPVDFLAGGSTIAHLPKYEDARDLVEAVNALPALLDALASPASRSGWDEAVAALEALEPHLDKLVCYASGTEYPPNAAVRKARKALEYIRSLRSLR